MSAVTRSLGTAFTLTRGLLATALMLLVVGVVLLYNRADLCDAYFDGCGRRMHPPTALAVELLGVLLSIGAFIGAHRLRQGYGRAVETDRTASIPRTYTVLVFSGLLAAMSTVVVALVASVGRRGPLDLLPDPEVTAVSVVLVICLVLAALAPAVRWMQVVQKSTLRVVLGRSPVTPGLREFVGVVLGPSSALPGVLVPRTGERVAAWAVEGLEMSTQTLDESVLVDDARDPDGSRLETRSRVMSTRSGWSHLEGSSAPVAISTEHGVVLLDLARLYLEADERWQDSIGWVKDNGVYRGMQQDMRDRGLTGFRVTALAFGAQVRVTARVELRDGQPWATAMKTPDVPVGLPSVFVRADGLRNLIQTTTRSRERRTF